MDFQIRLFRADGRLSVVLYIEAVGERDARLQALHLVQGDIVRAEIFTDKGLLNIYRRVSADEIANDNAAPSAETARNASDIHLH